MNAEESSASADWISKGSTKTHMGTRESTAQVHPRLLTRALRERAVAGGKTNFFEARAEELPRQAAVLLQNCGSLMQLCVRVSGTVKGVALNGSKVLGVKVDDYELPADAILIALGPWSVHAISWFP